MGPEDYRTGRPGEWEDLEDLVDSVDLVAWELFRNQVFIVFLIIEHKMS